MKKTKILIALLLLAFGLTACGSEKEYTQNEQYVLEQAKYMAQTIVIPSLQIFTDGSVGPEVLDQYTYDSLGIVIENNFGFPTGGYAYRTAVDNFISGAEEIGGITGIGEITSAEIADKDVIVHVEVIGGNRNAEAEVIVANDIVNMTMKSAALNPKYTLGEKMKKAGLNTVIGMGTVFFMLIVIAFIISLFGTVPKLLNKKKEPTDTEKGIDKAISRIEAQENNAAAAELSNDNELVAVIAAAIAAYEGSTSTDGFVVRSIRKVRR